MLTEERLNELGFDRRILNGEPYFIRNGFILKTELGKWLLCAEHSGYIVTTLLWIETEMELAMLYNKSTNSNLYN